MLFLQHDEGEGIEKRVFKSLPLTCYMLLRQGVRTLPLIISSLRLTPHDVARTTCSKVPCSKFLTPFSKLSIIYTLCVISIEVPRLCYMVQESPHAPPQNPPQVHFRFSEVSFIVLYIFHLYRITGTLLHLTKNIFMALH